jgi:hypothetical protein
MPSAGDLARPWRAPSAGVLPSVVPCSIVLARTAKAVVAVRRLEVYPGGFEINVVVLFPAQNASPFGAMGPVRRDRPSEPTRGRLSFGVAFAGGDEVRNTDVSIAGAPAAGDELKGPVLVDRGGSGDGRLWEETYWIWPLPPRGRLAFICEWSELGIPLSRRDVSSEPVRTAAENAVVIFPTDDLSNGVPGEPGA